MRLVLASLLVIGESEDVMEAASSARQQDPEFVTKVVTFTGM